MFYIARISATAEMDLQDIHAKSTGMSVAQTLVLTEAVV